MAERIDFRELKAHVSLSQVLTKYQVQLRRVNQHQLKGRCPLPTHTSESKDETFVVNPEIGGWACHSGSGVAARNTSKKEGGGLKKGGDVIEFVKFMESLPSLREAGVRLFEWYGPFSNTAGPVHAEAPQVDAVELDEAPT